MRHLGERMRRAIHAFLAPIEPPPAPPWAEALTPPEAKADARRCTEDLQATERQLLLDLQAVLQERPRVP
jgi:hypothetical protein